MRKEKQLRLACALLLIAAVAFGVRSLSAAEPNSAPRVEHQGCFAGLPSAPGVHIAKIQALGENEWLNLGAPAADPKWGVGRGRSWSCKMPYAPDLQGAFLAGQGVHGFIKPDGHYMDDIFFYDVNAHRWICVYPGFDTKAFAANVAKGELKVNTDGQLTDKDGQPVPFASIGGHSYHVHTYDSDQCKYIQTWGSGGIGGDQYTYQMPWDKEGRAALADQLKGKTDRVSGTPFYFNTINGKFERGPFPPQMPAKGQGDNVLFYLPTKKMLFRYNGAGETMLGDCSSHQWVKAGAKGPTPPGSCDLGACYDSKRERVYFGRGGYAPPQRKDEGSVYIYDVKTNAWSNPANKENAGGLSGTNSACVHYDSANDRVLVISRWEGKGFVSAYDPENGMWESGLPIPAHVMAGAECWHGFYSPELNVHFIYIAADSGGGAMWAYRFKAQKKK
jgi:hypothetical protein